MNKARKNNHAVVLFMDAFIYGMHRRTNILGSVVTQRYSLPGSYCNLVTDRYTVGS